MGPIGIGPRACLRSTSRVMMMSTVGAESTLLEGTLVLAGDSSAPSSSWYGWPGEQIMPQALAQLRPPMPKAAPAEQALVADQDTDARNKAVWST